jgi:DNA-binding NtrC family response regulator
VIERPSALQNACVLLLEDDALISIDTEDMLMSLGVRRVLVAHSVEEAQAIVDRERVDAAVLDLVIGHDSCEDFASRLAARHMPIVFASGMRDPGSLPEQLREVPTVDKPYTSQALHGALAKALCRTTCG